MVEPPKKSSLALLTAAAVALPATAPFATSATPVQSPQISLSHTSYNEDSIAEDTLLFGSTDRYEIEVGQFNLLIPVGENYELSIDYVYDNMSGASPWFLIEGADGNPLQVMSGASIEDERQDYAIGIKRYSGAYTLGTVLGYSQEDDYEAKHAGLSLDYEFEGKLTTLSLAIGYDSDAINATDADVFTSRPNDANRYGLEWYLGVTQVLDPYSLVQVGITHKRQWGYLSDPYKLVSVNSIALQDSRPKNRDALIFSSIYKRFFAKADGALTVGYRYFDDNWDLSSHTLEFAWHQNLGDHWSVTPSLRLYSQTNALFYDELFDSQPDNGYFSSDYRLSNYEASSYGFRIEYHQPSWKGAVNFERYRSGDKSLLGGENDNPGLVDFKQITYELEYTF